MKNLERIVMSAMILLAVGMFAAGCGGDPRAGAPAAQDGHEGHDHGDEADGHEEENGHEEDADHDEGDDHEDPADAGGGEHVELTAEQRRRIGLGLETAGPGRIERELSFPGEVVLNPDRIAHVVPRAAGIAREVTKSLGDEVEEGEILAWIESAELAESKLQFFDKEAEVGASSIELPRAREIFENVGRLLTLLDGDPSEAELDGLDGLEMGDYRGKLLTAHAAFVAAARAFERERTLSEKAVSSGQDLVSAQAEFQRARAEFEASMDTARYEVLVAFTEAARKRQTVEFEAVAAEQALRLKGVEEQTIADLRALVPVTAGLQPCLCTEPGCAKTDFPSVRTKLGADRRFGWYPLRAPLAGVLIEKHLTLGEKVGDDESVFTLADTRTVWVDFGVFQKDLALVEAGLTVEVVVTGRESSHPGEIARLSPVVDPGTRTTNARVVLANEENALRPGLFVTVRVALPTVEAAVVVPRSAVQILDEKEVVFVASGDGFEARPVTLGRGDRKIVEITHGLDAGQRFVLSGAFELKARIATSGLGAHAGHGH